MCSSVALHLVARIPHWPWSWLFCLDWPENLRDHLSTYLFLQLGIQISFFLGAGDPNWGLHSYAASTLRTEPLSLPWTTHSWLLPILLFSLKLCLWWRWRVPIRTYCKVVTDKKEEWLVKSSTFVKVFPQMSSVVLLLCFLLTEAPGLWEFKHELAERII